MTINRVVDITVTLVRLDGGIKNADRHVLCANVDQTTFIMHLSNHYYQIRDNKHVIVVIMLIMCHPSSTSYTREVIYIH